MREWVAHFVLLTLGLHTSVLSSFQSLLPAPVSHAGSGAIASAAQPAPWETRDTVRKEVSETQGISRSGSGSPFAAFDVRGWSAEGIPGTDGWTVAADGRVAESRVPGSPAFLVSARDYSEGTFEGTLRVVGGPGSHAAGFVLGYRAPLQADGSSNHEHLLLSWNPPANTSPGIRGEWVLSRVRSSQSPAAQILAHVGGSPDG